MDGIGPVSGLGTLSALGTSTTPSTATAGVTFNTDGSISYTTVGNVSTSHSGSTYWYYPVTGSPGNGYYIKFHLTSGNAWTGGLVDGTVYQLNSNRTVSWTTTSGTKTALVTVNIYSDAGGANIVGTGTLSIDCEST